MRRLMRNGLWVLLNPALPNARYDSRRKSTRDTKRAKPEISTGYQLTARKDEHQHLIAKTNPQRYFHIGSHL